MTTSLRLVLCSFLSAFLPGSLAAQAFSLRTTERRASFEDATSVGIRSMRIADITLAGRMPISTWGSAGLVARSSTASVESSEGDRATVSGFSDPEIFARARLGRIAFRGAVLLPLGSSRTGPGTRVVRGATADPIVGVPSIVWSTGGRLALDAQADIQREGLDIVLKAGLAVYGGFEEDVGSILTYRPGSERYVGIGVTWPIGLLHRFGLAGTYRSVSVDRVGGLDAYRPGGRLDVTGTLAVQIRSTSTLVEAHHRTRFDGEAMEDTRSEFDPLYQPLSTVVPGIADRPGRSLRAASVRTRSPLRAMDLLVEGTFRSLADPRSEDTSWLLEVGVGVDGEIGVLAGGQAFVRPVLSHTRGRVGGPASLDSAVDGWRLSLGIIWTSTR